MARVNITIPDEVLARARGANLNVSRIAAAAVSDHLDRLARVSELDAYLAGLDAQLGPVSEAERQSAEAWVDRIVTGANPGARHRNRSA